MQRFGYNAVKKSMILKTDVKSLKTLDEINKRIAELEKQIAEKEAKLLPQDKPE